MHAERLSESRKVGRMVLSIWQIVFRGRVARDARAKLCVRFSSGVWGVQFPCLVPPAAAPAAVAGRLTANT